MSEANFRVGCERVRWQRISFFLAMIGAAAILSSCGSSPTTTTATPTITVSCTPTDVTVLATSQCTARVLNLSSTLVNWSVTGGNSNGIINSGGLYTAPMSIPTNNVITITAASQVQASLTATQSLTLVQPTTINAVTCNDSSGASASTVSSGNTLSCTATASTGATVPVNWSISNKNMLGGNIGSISAQGIYTAPLVPPPGQQVSITATSQALVTDVVSVTATVVFGNKVLNGSYAFSTTGNLATKAFWARVGSFSAGGGFLINGLEDTNQGGAPNTVTSHRIFSGSYLVGPDGRGTMQFCEDTSASCPLESPAVTAYFRIVVVSPSQVQIIEFSPQTPPSATTIAGGEMLLQDPSVFSVGDGNLSGTYSFNFSGVSTSSTEESVVGDFAADGFGHIGPGSAAAPGEMDTTPSLVAQPVFIAASTYSIGTNGQGTITLGGLKFSVYPVSASRAKFIEIDTASSGTPTTPASILVGDAYKQQASSTCGWGLNALSGATVFETSGATSAGVIGDVGSFTASNGTVSSASIDENNGGTVSSQLGTLSGTYTMDPCGRGTLGIGTHTYVFYIVSASNAVLQETTSGVVSHGLLDPSQGGPFTDSTLSGSYAFKLEGANASGPAGNLENLLGQVTSSGTGTGLAGTLDLNDFGATQTGVAIAHGTYQTPSSLRTTMILPLATAPTATTRNLVLYMVSPTLFYALDVDPAPAGAATGLISTQF